MKPPLPHLPGLSLEPDGIGTVPLREVAGASQGHIPPPLWMRTAMWSSSIPREVGTKSLRLERSRGALGGLEFLAVSRHP